MAHFTYTAEKNDGEVYKGSADANDRFEVYNQVRREGGRIVSLTEEKTNSPWTLSYWNAKMGRVSEYEKVLFARNLGAMLAAGLPLSRALGVLERQAHNPKLAATLSQIANDVRQGEALNKALGKLPRVFSSLFVAMVRAGEEGGDLPQALTLIAEQMERIYTLKKKVRGALIYPAVIVVAIVGIGVLMMVKVVPTLAQTFKEMGAELPYSTQVVIGISDFMTQYSLFAALAAFAVIGGTVTASRTVRGKRVIDAGLLKMPVIGNIVREVNAARTARTLASLLSSGVDILTALGIVGEVVQNSYFRDVIEEAKGAVGRGEPLSATFSRNEHLYPAFVGEMAAVGEETGQITDMLQRLAGFYEDEVDRTTRDMSTIIEPFLMVIIGAAVGFFAVSMISPIYQLSQNI